MSRGINIVFKLKYFDEGKPAITPAAYCKLYIKAYPAQKSSIPDGQPGNYFLLGSGAFI
jgi:hypothetical protein